MSWRSLLAAVALIGAVGCTRSEPRSAPLDAQVVAAVTHAAGTMGRYDFDAAVTELEALARTHPASAEIAFNLALALTNRQREGDAVAAEARLRALIEHPVMGTRARYALALLLLYAGRDADAAPLFERTAREQSRDPFPAYFAGQARLAAAPTDALAWFEKATAIDPLLRSAHYGAFQALQRLGRGDAAKTRLDAFQTLETDPRARMAEFKYTRMGPLAEAVFLDAPAATTPVPAGALFERETVRHALTTPASSAATVTVVDLDTDGTPEIFVTGTGGARSNLVLRRSGQSWQPDATYPLAAVSDVRAALWGDVNNDGRTDAVLVRGNGGTTLWYQTANNGWRDGSSALPRATRADDVDGALYDADHDGDLDVLLVGRTRRLLNNNGDGTFRDITRAAGLSGPESGVDVGLALADLDADRDHDIVFVRSSPPHDVFLNDRVWTYRRAPGFDAFRAAAVHAVVTADLDANGRPELYTAGGRGLERWTSQVDGDAKPVVVAPLVEADTQRSQLAVADVDGDGSLDVLVSAAGTWAAHAVAADGAGTELFDGGAQTAAWTVAQFDAARGPSVIGITAAGLVEWAPGPGRHGFAALVTTGRSQSSDQRRSNVSGVGTKIHVRTGSRWTAFDTVRPQSGPGQSLQPVAVGLGGAARADLVSLLWSDGILQSELGLEGGRLHRIEETQRQLSSCPVLFAHDGTGTKFVTDILGVGGIGFFEQPGTYSVPYPEESVLLPDGALGLSDGHYRLTIGEPMEEVAYFDRFELVAYDLPPEWHVTLDERKAIAGPVPTGAPVYYREERRPSRVVNDRGDDVSALVAHADLKAAPPGAVDPRYIGLTAAHTLELTFDEDLERGPGRPVLMIDGWVEYPYAQTVFAAWQSGTTFAPPTLEARDSRGRWHVVAPDFGYPAGMPRRMTLPLPNLPTQTVALRLTTTQEIYWDRIAVVYQERPPSPVVHVLPMARATLSESGFARRTTGPQRTPDYDYEQRAPLWDTRHPRGWYTRFGDVSELVRTADDAVVVIGPGEEVAVEFIPPLSAPPPGWRRQFALRARGWCKDMDLYTKDGDTVEPLPGKATDVRARLHAAYNTRFESGQ